MRSVYRFLLICCFLLSLYVPRVWYYLDVLICVSVYINFYFLSIFYSFYLYGIFCGSCGLIQIKMMIASRIQSLYVRLERFQKYSA